LRHAHRLRDESGGGRAIVRYSLSPMGQELAGPLDAIRSRAERHVGALLAACTRSRNVYVDRRRPGRRSSPRAGGFRHAADVVAGRGASDLAEGRRPRTRSSPARVATPTVAGEASISGTAVTPG
jgi:hypothetical protein